MAFNVLESPYANVIFDTNGYKLLVFWNFSDMGYCLSMEKEPSVYRFNIVHLQEKNHALGGPKYQKSVDFTWSFVLPFGNYFGFFTPNFDVEFWWHSLAKSHASNLLIEISAQAILYLILVQQVF